MQIYRWFVTLQKVLIDGVSRFLDSKIYCKVHTVTILRESIEGAGEEQSSIDQSTHSLLTLPRILLLNTIRGLRWVLLHQVSSTATSNNNSQTMTGTVTMLQQLSSDSPTQPNDSTRSSTNMTLLNQCVPTYPLNKENCPSK